MVDREQTTGSSYLGCDLGHSLRTAQAKVVPTRAAPGVGVASTYYLDIAAINAYLVKSQDQVPATGLDRPRHITWVSLVERT